MPPKPNTKLRIAVPLIAGLGAIAFAAAVAVQSGADRRPGPASPDASPNAAAVPGPTQEPAAQEPGVEEPTSEPQTADEPRPGEADPPEDPAEARADTDQPTDPPPGGDDAPDPEATPLPNVPDGIYRVRPVEDPVEPGTLGSIEEGTKGIIEFSPYGAGIESLRLTGYTNLVGQDPTDPEHLVQIQSQTVRDYGSGPVAATPLAALRIEVDGQAIALGRTAIWNADPERPGRFTATIETQAGEPVVRIERAFKFEPDAYDFVLEQRIINLDDRPHTVRWVQAGPVDMPEPTTRYAGDKRRVRFGTIPYTNGPVLADDELRGRAKYLDGGPVETIWSDGGTEERLSWFAFTDRYFAVAVHTLYDQDDPAVSRRLRAVESIQRLILEKRGNTEEPGILVSRLTSPGLRLDPGNRVNLSMGVYAGPLKKDVIRAVPRLEAINLDEIVTYNIGGFCAEFCTASWMTGLLTNALRFFESLINDWALSIILLVLTVRGILHPLTRFVQTRMARFGAQMQVIGPKMKQIQEKYKPQPADDTDTKAEKQKKMQSEIGALFREEGVNPASALGCLPIFLQSPVWIALYSSLFFFFPMRHDAAFGGLFQNLTGGAWPFLADLSLPDNAIPLPAPIDIPLLSEIWGSITAINVLPLLMGFVFWAHQKYMTPQTSTTMSPEQEFQMKTMKVVSIGMFPIFMYNAPSALTIYFVTNSTIAIFESRWIRAQAKAKGLLDPEQIKEKARQRKAKRSAKGGFMERLKDQAETYQKLKAQQEQQRAQQRKKVANTSARQSGERYKKRK